MKIIKIQVKNFRILEDVEISLNEETTLIVGRNNSGKTSLTEIVYKFFNAITMQFQFEDFSVGSYISFKEAVEKYRIYEKAISENEAEEAIKEKENAYKALIPRIELNIYLEYEASDDLASLAKFIMDLDPDRQDVLISCEYIAKDPEKLIKEYFSEQAKYQNNIIEFLKKKYKTFYKEQIFAIDSKNPSNKRQIEKKSDIENVFLPRFIYAQNQLDDQSTDNSNGLSKGFEEYYKFNSKDNNDIEAIENLLTEISKDLDGKYEELFKAIFTDLKKFGINEGINLQKFKIKSIFEAERILKGNTKLFYDHDNNLLPEAHNGLGYSKLIFTILRFIGFYEEFDKRNPKPSFQLIFVEEPEAHLHPQMQYVFIKNIREFIREKNNWNVQVVITTHSSHIVSESGFNNIRYFDISDKKLVVKDLSEFQRQQVAKDPDGLRFLKQYMSLNRCDMFFADKIIMIEGVVERLLLPSMIKRDSQKLLSQYLSIIEVGGAYAHNFKGLLEFLNVKTLLITDIDSVDPNDNHSACEVSKQNAHTSNKTLKDWIPNKKKIQELHEVQDVDKTKNKIKVAYQVPESTGEKCGRSFEEAFIIKNAKVFAENTVDISSKRIFLGKCESVIKNDSYFLALKIDKKTDFAFDIMLLEGCETPRYIKEGLVWLEK